jgi:hypothetical protein
MTAGRYTPQGEEGEGAGGGGGLQGSCHRLSTSDVPPADAVCRML